MTEHAFSPAALGALGRAYPESAALLSHGLCGHPLLTLEALVALSHRMRPKDVSCLRGDVPVGAGPEGAPENPLSPEETIRSIERCGSWMVLKYIEQDSSYSRLLDDVLHEIEPAVLPRTGPMLRRRAFIFVSSPNAVTPFHFDPEHNILLHLQGEKTMTVFPAADERLVSPAEEEAWRRGGHNCLPWNEGNSGLGRHFDLFPGSALYVPFKAPHFVRNGPAPSVSLSITWQSGWSCREDEAQGFNQLLRRAGVKPRPPRRFPHDNHAKAIAFRIVDKARRISRLSA